MKNKLALLHLPFKAMVVMMLLSMRNQGGNELSDQG